MIVNGNILNVFNDEIYPGEIHINKGIIESIKEVNKYYDNIIVPGFIDSHIHIESSMLTPSRFAEIALKHGTTSVVTDPHEIANILGIEGIEYMINDAKFTPLRFYFGAPSCVPATEFETAGAKLNAKDIDYLLSKDDFVSLGEVMDYVGVINNKEDIINKIKSAKKYNKPIDGHAPQLSGLNLQKYIAQGISTDHESTTKKEIYEKKRNGMKIMLRQGSGCHDMEHLISTGGDFIVTDDISSEDLIYGHMDKCLRKAVDLGMDPFDAIKMVTINPAEHYNLNSGSITPGKNADLVVIDNLNEFNVNKVIVNGNIICKKQKVLFRANPKALETTLHISEKHPKDFDIKAINSTNKGANVNVIKVIKDEITTDHTTAKLNIEKGNIIPSVYEDILKISVVERYGNNTVSNAFIKGFEIKNGAIASSVSHDSHNIIVVGTNSKYMAEATNTLIKNKGGLVAVSPTDTLVLPLPIAGLMSDKSAYTIAKNSKKLNQFVQDMGCNLHSPYTTLSFMALLTIPSLKISDKGLFDVNNNRFIDVIKHEE